MTIYKIKPCPALRQVRKDIWNPSPSVLRYRNFKDEVRIFGIKIPERPAFRFRIPMPDSWSKNKKDQMRGTIHLGKPDSDNLLKALWDAVYKNMEGVNDSHINQFYVEKIWDDNGGIEIVSLPESALDIILQLFA